MLNARQRELVKTEAATASLPYTVLAAIVDKESNGKFFWKVNGKDVPALNIEPHRFYKYLGVYAPDRLKQAVDAGLAAKKRGVIKVPTSYAGRYDMLERMSAIHINAAYMSVSVGAGQVMGENYSTMGYIGAEALFRGAFSEIGQVRQIIAFIKTKPPLVAAVKARDVKGIAYYYNGPAYKENHYDTELAELIRQYEGGIPTGSTDNAVQARILALGYADIKEFQSANNLKVDGVAGKITLDKLVEVEAERKRIQSKPAKTVGTVAAGTAVVVGTGAVVTEGASSVQDVIDKTKPVLDTVQQVGAISPKLVIVLVAALVIGVIAYVVIQKLRKR